MYASDFRTCFRLGTHSLKSATLALPLLLMSMAVGAQQIVFQPSQNQGQAVDFGPLPIGQKSTQTLTFKINNASGLGAPQVYSGGADSFNMGVNFDFIDASTGTCSVGPANGFPFPAGSTCTVDITFRPQAAGTRTGAITLNQGGNTVATVYLLGTGVGPQVILLGGDNQRKTIISEQNGVIGTTLFRDDAGAFYADLFGPGFPPSSVTHTRFTPSGTGYTLTAVPGPGTLAALDAAGNVYLSDGVSRVLKETPSGNGNYVESLVASGIRPDFVAVDPRGNVYIADNSADIVFRSSNTIIYKATYQDGSYTLSTALVDQPQVFGMAVDAAGRILTDTNYDLEDPIVPTDTPAIAAAKTAHYVGLFISDSKGDLYTATPTGIIQYDFAGTAPTLKSTTAVGGPAVVKIAPVANIGNTPLVFTGNATPLPRGFVLDPGSSCPGYSAQAASNALDPGTACQVAIDFQPTQLSDGSGAGALVLQDNNLNVPNSQQRINLVGVATPGALLITLAPSVLPPATIGVPYAATLVASGGVAPYSFSTFAPPGLVLSPTGVLSGVPTNYGTFAFPVYVTDSTGAQGQALINLTVNVSQNSGTVDASKGFTSALGLHLNGSAAIAGTDLILTDGKVFEASTAWSSATVDIRRFTSDFQFQLGPNTQADGFTFALQNLQPNALGYLGGDLGYGGLSSSVAVKFDLFNNAGEQPNSVGFYSRGNMPTFPSSVLQNGLDLKSGHIFQAHITNDGTSLTLTVTDTATGKSSTYSQVLDLPTLVGSPTAYVGFTAGTGALTSNIRILNWTYQVQ